MASCEPGEGAVFPALPDRRGRATMRIGGSRSRLVNGANPSPASRLFALAHPLPQGEREDHQNPGSAATVTVMVPETSAISRSVLES
jgi:hypothetical protein